MIAGCNHKGCQNTVSLAKWGKKKLDWHFTKGGRAFCPTHIPTPGVDRSPSPSYQPNINEQLV